MPPVVGLFFFSFAVFAKPAIPKSGRFGEAAEPSFFKLGLVGVHVEVLFFFVSGKKVSPIFWGPYQNEIEHEV